jgi:hypothetical protein
MHGDVEQEGLYQNCEFHDPRGRGRAKQLNIFNFTSPILFKFGMKHLWVKGNKNSEFHDPCPLGALGAGQKLPKIDKFSKIFFSIITYVQEKLNAW